MVILHFGAPMLLGRAIYKEINGGVKTSPSYLCTLAEKIMYRVERIAFKTTSSTRQQTQYGDGGNRTPGSAMRPQCVPATPHPRKYKSC